MTLDPYQPPRSVEPAPTPTVDKKAFTLAAVAAFLAGGYWALITLLLMARAHDRSAAGAQVILPLILVGLYIARGLRLLKGDPAAARRILWLHVIGAAGALLQMQTSRGFMIPLQGVKVLINVFGVVTAYRASRPHARPDLMPPAP